ncbi:hypothetical protein [Shewanella sp. 8A]|uniref:hypothetical protein n=1 Tax=Shewanella sp. 8A TaxID=2943323 RepID=UPI00201B019E|nr:hypothetical protein [Shewanella sp. 8A]
MQQTDSASQRSGADQNDSAWKNHTGKQSQIPQQQVSLLVQIGRGVTFLVKWLWLLTMFLLGIALFWLLAFFIFEYSFSLSELDLIETLFLVFLFSFVYQYIKHCLHIDAPFVRKIITPFVHQAHLGLVFLGGSLLVATKLDIGLEELDKIPMLDVTYYILAMLTLSYSDYCVGMMVRQPQTTKEPVVNMGAAK